MSEMEQPDLIKEMGGIEAARAVVTGKASKDIFFPLDQIRHPTEEELKLGKRSDSEL